MLPLTEAKEHRFYDFLFSFDPHNMLCAICGRMFLSARVLQHIKALSSKVVNW
ncbi:hypothetical protein HMPREF1152_1289 [Mogibacterium sp. CM50]|nr:hypothetical protein HMPREF1152_1289 [Mogibacterium sp. CM50]